MPYNQTFESVDFSNTRLKREDYDCCEFLNCNFQEADLCTIQFTECIFTECNLSNAQCANTAFKDAEFNRCKMIGLALNTCNTFLLQINFNQCQLDYCNFSTLQLKGFQFNACNLIQCDFTDTNASGLHFPNCDFSGALFENTNLSRCNLKTAFNFSINPANNTLKKTLFVQEGLIGLVQHLNIIIS